MSDLYRRVVQVKQLLASLLDVTPAPDTSTGRLVARSSTSGPVADANRPCGICNPNASQPATRGWVIDRFKQRTPCEACGGHYKVGVPHPGRGWVPVDTHLVFDDIVGNENVIVTKHVTVRCDRCDGDGVWKFRRCALCDGTGRRSVTPEEFRKASGSDQEETTDLWGQGGSWHELDRLLLHLSGWCARTHRLIWATYVLGKRPEASLVSQEAWAVRMGLEWLADRMPHPIMVPGWAKTAEKRRRDQLMRLNGRGNDPRALEARNREIRKLVGAGRPVQWVAAHSAVSVRTVYEIVNGLKS